MNIKHLFVKFSGAVKISVYDFAILMSGQSNSYAILQASHRIEKGLAIENPRKGWGWKKIEKLVGCIHREENAKECDQFAIDTGVAVVKAFLERKLDQNDEESKMAKNFLSSHPTIMGLIKKSGVFGGAYLIDNPTPNWGGAEQLEYFFSSRHSIRDFDQREVNKGILERAVKMALYCPSACNRQPSKIYCLDGKKRAEIGYENTYKANKYLIITSDIKAFTRGEYGDWIVSTSIFAGYLTLALHGLGIGSCVIRKNIFLGDEYNNALCKVCNIPKNEKIILEIAIGYYKNSNCVTYSNRREASSIISYISNDDLP